jgi:hypothetical protein
MSGPCDRLARRLPALVDDPGALVADELDHVRTCLRCQAALAQHRRIRRTLHALAPGEAGPPGAEVVRAALEERAARRRRAVRRGMAVGLATVTAVGLGAAAVAARRRSA